MWNKTDSLSVVETVKPCTEYMWFWPSCFLIPLSPCLLPGFTSLRLSVWILPMLVSDSSLPYITFPLLRFILFHLWLTSIITRLPFLSFHCLSLSRSLCLLLCLLHQPDEPTVTGATTTRAGGSAGSTRGTATEREDTTEEIWARATTTPTSEPKKKTHPLFRLSSAANCSLPVSLSSLPLSPFPQTLLHPFQPKTLCPSSLPAPHCPALSSTPGSPSQPVS